MVIPFALFSPCQPDYSRYINASKDGGVEICCWQKDGGWFCAAVGVLNGTVLPLDELFWCQENLPFPLPTMKEILSGHTEDERRFSFPTIVNYPETGEELYRRSEDMVERREPIFVFTISLG